MGTKKTDKMVERLYYKHFDGVPINMMAIPEVWKRIENLIAATDEGPARDAGMRVLVEKYRMG